MKALEIILKTVLIFSAIIGGVMLLGFLLFLYVSKNGKLIKG